jgi:AcrR family transcriptional regulator
MVDHQAQRARIADALMRVAADRGLEAVSVRHVAAEAGVSTGMVQHYFRTKDAMMAFALDMVSRNAEARIAADAPSLGANPTPRALVRTLLVQILPLDETRTREAKVTLAFLAYAAVRPEAGARLHEIATGMRAFLAAQIRAAAAVADPETAATALFALVDGLGMHMLTGQCSPEAALATLDAHLDSVLGRP